MALPTDVERVGGRERESISTVVTVRDSVHGHVASLGVEYRTVI